jgi:hypothetical protein
LSISNQASQSHSQIRKRSGSPSCRARLFDTGEHCGEVNILIEGALNDAHELRIVEANHHASRGAGLPCHGIGDLPKYGFRAV